MVPIYSHVCSSQKLFYLQNPELCSTLAFQYDALFQKLHVPVIFWDLPALSRSSLHWPLVSDPSLFLFPTDYAVFFIAGVGGSGENLDFTKILQFFFFCLGAYRSLLSGWGPLKRKYLLKISKNPEPLKTFFSCDCLAVSHWDLVISHLIALTDNLEYVGFLSLVSLFTLKTCCQLFPFRMESSPGEWLVAFRSSFPF